LARKPPAIPEAPVQPAAPKKGAGRGGRRPGAGRKKGARNKRTVALIAQAQAQGILPHEFLASVARGEPVRCSLMDDVTGLPIGEPLLCFPSLDQRIDAARAAAPYFAARLASIEHSGKIGVTRDASELSDDELAAIIAGDTADTEEG
jgi:hypothetical protein